MDTVFIRELKIDTVIGIYDWERRIRQTVVLDVEMAWNNRPAAETEKIEHALDYSAVAQRLISFVRGSEFLLVEALAEQCAAIVLQEFSVPWLRLAVSKPGAVREASAVGVVLERGSRPVNA